MYNISIYTFKISVVGLENKIWRSVEFTNTCNIARVAYTVLASFQTAMYHLYNIEYKEKKYDCMICADDYQGEQEMIDARETRLCELNLKIGNKLTMTYDYGVNWEFNIVLTDIKKMSKEDGYIVNYPKIVAGAGFGIIEDRHYSEVLEIMNEIDETNNVSEFALTPNGSFEKWDYRKYDLKKDNKTLKERLYNAIVAYEELTDL